MEILNYGDIEKVINEYLENKCVIVEEVVEKENISYYLDNVIRRREIEVSNIHNLKVVRTFDMDVYVYNIRKNGYFSKNMLVTKDDRKLISIEESSVLSPKVNNYDSMFCIYDPKTNKIENKIRFQQLDVSGTVVNKVIVMNKISNSSEYDRSEYKVYKKDDEILCIKKGIDDYYLDDTGVDFMMNHTIKKIESEGQSILIKVNEILHNEIVKTYTIKKKEGKRTLYKV